MSPSMKYLFYLVIAFTLLQPNVSDGQWLEDFSDENLSQDPPWFGDTSNFIFEDGRLRLNASQEGNTSIFSEISSNENQHFEWSFELEIDFSPSANNKARLILISSDSLFSAPVYLLNFGESGSSDAVELQRIDSLDAIPIIIARGVEGMISSSFRRNYKVTYNNGLWEVWSGEYYSPYMQFETSGTDSINFPFDAYFGIQLDYTSSHTEDFFFDDIFCGNALIDTLAPIIENIEVVNEFELYITFSESVDSLVLNPFNYTLQIPPINPVSVDFIDSFQKGVRLEFQEEFLPYSSSILFIDSLIDIENNLITGLLVEFVYAPDYEAQYGEIRFNEIMPDPTPPVGLPAVEFIELINTSDSLIDIASYSIYNSGNPMLLPSFLLEPHTYVILCKEVDTNLFASYGDVLGIENWISLLNTGDSLLLVNSSGNVLDELNYSDKWFEDPLKKEGGWSLERIDANVDCKSEVNWKESNSFYGGTPGYVNSVDMLEIENEITLIQAYLLDSSLLRVEISGELDTSFFANLMYSSSPPFEIIWENSTIDESGLSLACFPPFQQDQTYHLSLHNLNDCRGIEFPDQELVFGIPEKGKAGDVIINEILFNPYTGANDFIEIYNSTSHFIDLKNWRIIELKEGIHIEDARISDHSLLIAPNELIVFSRDVKELPLLYPYCDPMQLVEVDDLPNFSNENGEVMLVNDEFIIIDSLIYDEDMHFSLLDDLNGVSLERIHPDLPSNKKSTWVSSAESVDFATPGYKNSQFSKLSSESSSLYIEPQLFTPNNDGYNDELFIHFNLKEGGWMVNVVIYNAKGVLIKNVTNNSWMESKGVIRWDGLTNNNEEASVGIYIVYFEAFNSQGQIESAKKVCVLGKQSL